MRLRTAAVGVALGEAANDAREEGGNNRGPYVRKYLRPAGFNEGAPWCAAFVYWAVLEASELLGLTNPFASMRYKALVAAYLSLARDSGWIIPPLRAREGDLVIFNWSSGNHIGFILERPPALAGAEDSVAPFFTIEGNTAPGVGLSESERQREGDGVFVKRRRWHRERVTFVRWDLGQIGPRPGLD